MKKRLLFFVHYLELGGAEMSLIGLLESLDYSKYEVDLFVYAHRGGLMKAIPPQVHLLPEVPEYAQIERPIKDVLKDGYWRIAAARLLAKYEYARYVRRKHPHDGSAIFSFVARRVAPLMPVLDRNYDIAVSYLAPHDYVLGRVKAGKKLCWIHTDYSQIDVNRKLELPVWNGYDTIIALSESVRDSFAEVFPELKSKLQVHRNLIPKSYISNKSKQIPADVVSREMPYRQGEIKLLSVGRFCAAKNYDNVPDICRRLNEKLAPSGLKAVWYLIGFGGDEALIRSKIQSECSPGQVVILGKKDNPYPYMLACDYYVQPSRYEGDPVTVHEAAALGKPFVITAFPTAADVVSSEPLGTIVPLENEACACGLAEILLK
ncbi:MAG: glycosyltransferase [Bacteroidales bacterium]|nr:glycosyltransferase [Bacteroidales bacterium]